MSDVTMALLGSGEFEPWSAPVERWLIQRSPRPEGVALVVPTAAAHEGEESFATWGAKGLEHFASLDLPAEVLPLRTREDAHRDEVVARLDAAALVFFSGGNPARLTDVVRDTPFWAALVAAVRRGLPYAGCSAGVACLTDVTFDSDTQDLASVWAPGLAYLRDVLFGPHWDIVDTWIPGATAFILGSVRPGQTFVGLDEDTAMVGDGRAWHVMGTSKVHILHDGEWTRYAAGDAFELPLRFAHDA